MNRTRVSNFLTKWRGSRVGKFNHTSRVCFSTLRRQREGSGMCLVVCSDKTPPDVTDSPAVLVEF